MKTRMFILAAALAFAGATAGQYTSPEDFQSLILEIGRIPAERNTTYTRINLKIFLFFYCFRLLFARISSKAGCAGAVNTERSPDQIAFT